MSELVYPFLKWHIGTIERLWVPRSAGGYTNILVITETPWQRWI